MNSTIVENNINNEITKEEVNKQIEEAKKAIDFFNRENPIQIIDREKTIKNGKEECDKYSQYIEIYLRNKELATTGYLSGTRYDNIPSSGSSGKSPDNKFVGYITSTEKKKPLIEFDKLINAVSQIDENCGKYLYMTYYENMKPKEINAALHLKNRYEGYRVLKKAHFIVACLADEVSFV